MGKEQAESSFVVEDMILCIKLVMNSNRKLLVFIKVVLVAASVFLQLYQKVEPKQPTVRDNKL